MKLNLKFLFALLALLLLLLTPARAQVIVLNDGYVTATNTGTTKAEVLFAASPSRAVRACYADVTSDLAGSVLLMQAGVAESLVISNCVAAATTIFVADSSQFAVNDIVMVQTATNSVASGKVSAIVNATNITLSTAFTATPASIGDRVYKMGPGVALPVGAASVRLNADAIFAARRARPMLLNITGTSACKINGAVVCYDAP